MLALNENAIDRHRFTSETARWQAVLTRDADADGHFYFAVLTTGIYCRPSCPARRPRAENTRFFETTEAADAAGYRACKRCKPDLKPGTDVRSQVIAQACRLIDAAETAPPLDDLARAVGISRFHFHRLFKATLGITPRQYAVRRRLQRLSHELTSGAPLAQAIYGAGYGSPSRLYETSHATLGMTPAAVQKGGRGKHLRWTVSVTPLGPLLVAASDAGIAMIAFGDNEATLEAALRHRFPAAECTRDDGALGEQVRAIAAYIETPRDGLVLPLDIQGTAFQQRVWRALQAIPPGRTLSYGALAAALGQPNGARAVARACAANEIALAVPCHRVIGADGGLAGYRWGLERKRALLSAEAGEPADGPAPLDRR